MAKSNLPKTLGSEYTKLSELAVKYNRTTTGNTSYTSTSSGTTYNTAGTAYDNTGEDGLYALLQIALENYIILAADFNNKIDTGALSDTDISVDDSSFDTISGSDQGAINASIDAKFTADDIDYVRNPGYAVTGGSPTAYTVSTTPAPTALTTGMRIAIKLHVNCGAAPTLNWDGLGAKTLLKNGDTAIISGEYKQNMVLNCVYDGTNFLIDAVDYAGEVLTTQGDMLYRDASGLQRLAKGTSYQQITMNSGATAPEWHDSLQSLMTAQGDIVYASGANTPSKLSIGDIGKVLISNGTTPLWDYAISGKYVVSDTILVSADTERIGNPSSYTEIKSFRVNGSGKFRVSMDIKADSGAGCNIRIYVNGVYVGLEISSSKTSYSTKTLDLVMPIDANSTVELWWLKGGSGNIYIKNVKLCGTLSYWQNTVIID